MDAVTPQRAQTADAHSHLVRPADMEWQKTRFPGCEAKTLLFDRKTGLMTALMRFAPGAVLPDHEHVNIEQTYVLEGSLVDKEGPAQGIECKAGEFIWREEGSRHVAWSGRRADARNLPGAEQVLRGRRPRHRRRGRGLGRGLGTHAKGLISAG
jgi:anti-sigma factor ChrR (cupin superfamily)